VLKHDGHFYHLNPDLVYDTNAIVLCPVCAKDPMMKNDKSIAAGNDYGRLGYLKPLNSTTRNACVPVRLYNINLQIWANYSTNHSIAFPINGSVECLKKLTFVDVNHQPQVPFLGPRDEWQKVAGKYKHLYEMDTDIAYEWLQFWVNANHPSFKNCIIDESTNAHHNMNMVTNEIVNEAITTDDPDIVGIATELDDEDKKNDNDTFSNIEQSVKPYTIQSAVLPKPSLIDANINAAIHVMCQIIQPEDNDTNDNALYKEVLPNDIYNNNRPVIPVSCESNKPIVEWTDNATLLRRAFPDKFLFGQGIQEHLPTHKHWKHYSLYYDG
jgi:hypothetical protein